MIIVEFIITMIIIVAAVFPAMKLYDWIESDLLQAMLIIAYGVFSISMVVHWFAKYLAYQLSL